MQSACAMLLSVLCVAQPHFSTLSHKQHDFKKRNFIIKCVFWFCLQSLSKVARIIEEFSDILSHVCISFHVKWPLFLSDFNET